MQCVVNVLLFSTVIIIAKISDVFTQQKATDKCEEYYGPIETRRTFGKKDIAGGYAASLRELPFIAALGYEVQNEIKYFCGANLISENFVVTAAHCIYSKTGGFVKYVRIGDLDLNSTEDDEYVQMFDVKDYQVHPKYKFPEKYHDIALIELNKPVKFAGFYTRPICLSPGETSDPRYLIGGWGQVQYGMKGSNVLQIAHLIGYRLNICEEHFTADITLPRGINRFNQLCAGPASGNGEIADTCEGDSGGPLAYVKRRAFHLAGVTSFGKPCALGLIPGVYTSVPAHIAWIENIVWPDNDDTEVGKEDLTIRNQASHSNKAYTLDILWTLCLLIFLFTNLGYS